ncbi:MAG: NnrS family protein, partial [Gammaproteobacteria bacterium]|nr:NnrS family protein [Gammaproteobacteria bacterium]
TALHMLTVGAMGTMILSMISRVSLGHTGRRIVAGYAVTVAFMFILMAALFRTAGPVLLGNYITALVVSALLWAIAYGLFVVKYLRILTRPRIDGRPG